MKPPTRLARPFAVLLAVAATAVAQDPQPEAPPEQASAQAFEKAVFEAEAAGNLDAAVAIYEELADDSAIPPRLREAVLFRLGKALGEMGQTEDALKVFGTYLKEFPKGEHAEAIRTRLRQPRGAADIANHVNLLGLWELDTKALELMPGGRYQRLNIPIDHEDLAAPKAPFEKGRYELDNGTITLTPAGGKGQALKWTLIDGTLTLNPADADEQRRVRTRRPFRFPPDVGAELEQLTALVFLKLNEARAVQDYLSDSKVDTGAARDMIALSGAVDAEIRRISGGTTAELPCLVVLDLANLAATLLERDDRKNALAVLTALAAMNPSSCNMLLGPFRSPPGLTGTWRATDNRGRPEMKFSESGTLDMTGHSRDESDFNLQYTTNGDRLTVTRQGHITSEQVYLLGHDRLGLYDLRSGEQSIELERSSQDGLSADYFSVHHYVLEALLPVANLTEVRARLADYLYTISTQCDGTTAGLLARAGVRQVLQIDAAYVDGNSRKGLALTSALGGTLRLLLSEGELNRASLPQQLTTLGYIDINQPTVQNAHFSLYDGAIRLQPTDSVLPDISAITKQADMLRQRIAETGLVRTVLLGAREDAREAFLATFEGMQIDEISALLVDTMETRPIENPPGVALSVFRHHDAALATQLGNALGESIAEMRPPEGDLWSWEIADRATADDLPKRLLISNKSVPPPIKPEPTPTDVRGAQPWTAHGRFLYEAYISRLIDGQSAVVPEGRFVMIERRGKRFAVRRDSGDRITIVAPGADGGEPVVEQIEVKWGDGPGARKRGLVLYGEVTFLCDPKIWSGGGYLSLAYTPWTEPSQIRFDATTLRWYYLHTS